MHITAGTIIDDRYEVIAPIGAGGMGVVYKVVQLGFDRHVALKILLESIENDTDLRTRFEREALAINTLKHRNIVSFYGFGVWQSAPYMVMELLNGKSLQEHLSEQPPLAAQHAMDIVKQICDGLACAHSNGIVHRDLKPSNVFLCSSSSEPGLVKLIDFGLAKMLPAFGKELQSVTQAGLAVGSVLYMSPEQCQGLPTDNRSDIYSAGCILYQCLTGSPPFLGDDPLVVMKRHLHEPTPDVTDLGSDQLTDALQKVLNNAMAKEPADRYQSAHAFACDLQKLLSGDTEDLQATEAGTVVVRTAPKPVQHAPKMLIYIAAVLAAALVATFNFTSRNVQPTIKEPVLSSVQIYWAIFNARKNNKRLQPLTESRAIDRCLRADARDHELDDEQRFYLDVFEATDCMELNNPERAAALLDEATPLWRKHHRDDWYFLDLLINNRLALYADKHQLPQAEALLVDCVGKYGEEMHSGGEPFTWCTQLGMIYRDTNRPADLRKLLKNASVCAESRYLKPQVSSLRRLGELYEYLGDRQQAKYYYKRADLRAIQQKSE